MPLRVKVDIDHPSCGLIPNAPRILLLLVIIWNNVTSGFVNALHGKFFVRALFREVYGILL